MRAYYINLARRTDRRAVMEEQFARLGMAAERIDATTPADLTAQQKAEHLAEHLYHRMAPTELCCNLSHLAAIDTFLASGAAYAAFFEDDAVLSLSLPSLLAAIERDGMEADVLRLETFNRPIQLSHQPTSRLAEFSLHSIHGWAWGTAAYVLTREAAIAFRASPAIQTIIVDRALYRRFPDMNKRIRARQLVPALAIQQDRLDGSSSHSASDLQADRTAFGNRDKSESPLWHKLRRFKDNELGVRLPATIDRLTGRSAKRLVAFRPD